MNDKPFRRLRAALTVTFVLSLLVVFAGATVRATGSGMGCPDWPLCYGCWIPPVSADQLPEGYAEKYAVAGRPAVFDAAKTWIEYVNRLLGAITGLSMLVSASLTLAVVRRRPFLGVLVLLAVLVLGFVAWLGARVVGTFLAPYAVTLHLWAAYSLLALLLAAREVTDRVVAGTRPRAPRIVFVGLGLVGLTFLLQGNLGIRTREEVEAWLGNHQLTESLWNPWGGAFDLHKLAGFLVLAATSWLGWIGWHRYREDRRFALLCLLCATLVAFQGILGLILWWAGAPLWAKPFHLLFATGAWAAWAAAVFHTLPSGVFRHDDL